ncbi:hypothetical protein NMG60_11019925 [Bertholletia excelsa]
MPHLRGRGVVCDERRGCPSPWPGGLSWSADDPTIEHSKCSCGEHCGCNPCTCTKRVTTTLQVRRRLHLRLVCLAAHSILCMRP